jgi:hypothetical protein
VTRLAQHLHIAGHVSATLRQGHDVINVDSAQRKGAKTGRAHAKFSFTQRKTQASGGILATKQGNSLSTMSPH